MVKKWQEFIRRKGTNPELNRRKFAILLFAATIGIFFLFIGRFTYIVLVGEISGESLEKNTQQLYQGSSVVKAKRGTIYDRNGNVIAEDATSYSLYAVLDKTYMGVSQTGKTKDREKLYVQDKDKPSVAKVIANNTDLKEDYVLNQLNQESKQVEFGNGGKGLTLQQKNAILEQLEAQEIKGIYFNEHSARTYPNGKFSSHLIGFTQPKSEDTSDGMIGVMGIEEAENDILAGQDGLEEYVKDSNQRPIAGTIEVKKKAEEGQDIYTTLDLNLGMLLETKLDEVQERFNVEEMTAMLVEAETGNILAASQRPTFNPETKEGLEKKSTDESEEEYQWFNLLTEIPFEPGSTMKAFTVASSFDIGQFDPNGYIETGKYVFEDDTEIKDWNKSGVGVITYRQAFAFSSNVAMVAIEQKMTNPVWEEYLHKFGFGQLTGTNLPNENLGYIPDMKNDVNASYAAFGQGISVTPFQMVQAYTAIANEGNMLQPNYISKIVDKDGNETVMEPISKGQPISAESANQTLDLMTSVIEDEQYGTGHNYKLEGYQVAAKTGTAQIWNNNTGSYYQDRYIFSVSQIAPAEDPKYIMYVTVRGKEDKGGEIVSSISNPVLKMALDLDVDLQK